MKDYDVCNLNGSKVSVYVCVCTEKSNGKMLTGDSHKDYTVFTVTILELRSLKLEKIVR